MNQSEWNKISVYNIIEDKTQMQSNLWIADETHPTVKIDQVYLSCM